ncbi:MAG: hypothetical protein HY901_16545 [Deltaproteobacteria bacterium]|nr:hypothetical protein [Deltaproteobacteria bacterium]
MARTGWSVDGQRLELAAGLPAGKLRILGGGEIKLKAKGDFPVQLGARTLTLRRSQRFMGVRNELVTASDEVIPPTPRHVEQIKAPAQSRCAQHSEVSAAVTCARCGAFACSACSVDGTHCAACLKRILDEANQHAAALAFASPIVVFGVLGGLLGALVAAPAGLAAVAIAKRTERKAIKVGAAVGLYGLATLLYVVLFALIRSGGGDG